MNQMVSAQPLVTIVIRNFNRGERILRAFDSALAQAFNDYEIVFVDDASTDGSVQLVRDRYGHLDNLLIIENPINLGAAVRAISG